MGISGLLYDGLEMEWNSERLEDNIVVGQHVPLAILGAGRSALAGQPVSPYFINSKMGYTTFTLHTQLFIAVHTLLNTANIALCIVTSGWFSTRAVRCRVPRAIDCVSAAVGILLVRRLKSSREGFDIIPIMALGTIRKLKAVFSSFLALA